jgi:hypothetical protein
MKLQKQFGADRYVFWNVMSCYLQVSSALRFICKILTTPTFQAKDASTPTTMRPVLLKLAHRLLTSTNLGITTERFHLHLTVLKELELWEEADILINSEAGKLLCPSMLACEELRREIVRARGSWQPEGDLARARILENKSVIYHNSSKKRSYLTLAEIETGWSSWLCSMPRSLQLPAGARLIWQRRTLQPQFSPPATCSCR